MKTINKFICLTLCLTLMLGIVPEDIRVSAYTPEVVTNSGIVYPISLTTGKDAKGKLVFPDTAFLSYIKTETFWTGEYEDFTFDLDGNGVLSKEECELVRVLSVTNKTEVKSVKGIEAFPKLRELYVSGSGITELDLSNNPRLQVLKTSGNAIRTLDVSGCPLLKTLEVSQSQLTNLNLSRNPDIEFLNCASQQVNAYQYKENGQYRVMLSDLKKELDLAKVSDVKINGSAGDGVNTGYDEKTGMAYCPDKITQVSYNYDVNFVGVATQEIKEYMSVTLNLTEGFREVYETNGGSRVLPQYFSISEEDKAPEHPKRVGYAFTGWYKTAECKNGQEWSFGTTLAENVILYAGWTKKFYTVRYNPNGGTMSSKEKKDKVDWWSVDLLPTVANNPIRTGYQISGWKTESGKTLATTSKVTYGEASGNSDKTDTTITTIWKPKCGYKVNYTASLSKKLRKKVKKFPSNNISGNVTWTTTGFLTKKVPTLKGYNFIGWYTAKKGGKQITNQTVYKDLFASQFLGDSQGNIPTIYARFQKKTKLSSISNGSGKVVKIKALWKKPKKSF